MIAEIALPATPRPASLADALRALFTYLLSRRERASQRRALEALDERLLRDVGLRRRGYWPGTD